MGRIARIGIVLGIVLAAAPVRPAVAGGGGCHGPETTSAHVAEVAMQDMCFAPTLARVPLGSTVRFLNKDAVFHTVTGANAAWGSFENLGDDAEVTMRFTRAGVYPYYCLLHPGMAGAILVGDANGPGAADVVTGSPGITPVSASRDETSVKVGATAPAGAGASPWLVLPIALATAGVGFGIGRRVRNEDRTLHEPGGGTE